MRVQISYSIPKEFATQKGLTYETRYLYTGFSRYDTERKTISRITEENGGVLLFHEAPYSETVFPRVYHAEHVRVTIFSESPKVWKEELSSDMIYFFREIQDQQAAT